MDSYRIVMADDHYLIREGLRSILEENADLQVVGEASDGLELLFLLDRLKPHLVILDISMPNLPDGVVISGKVTDSAGRGIGNVEIGAVSQSLTGVTSAELSRWDWTDPDGNYRILVLSGTNYKLTFYPPVPAP